MDVLRRRLLASLGPVNLSARFRLERVGLGQDAIAEEFNPPAEEELCLGAAVDAIHLEAVMQRLQTHRQIVLHRLRRVRAVDVCAQRPKPAVLGREHRRVALLEVAHKLTKEIGIGRRPEEVVREKLEAPRPAAALVRQGGGVEASLLRRRHDVRRVAMGHVDRHVQDVDRAEEAERRPIAQLAVVKVDLVGLHVLEVAQAIFEVRILCLHRDFGHPALGAHESARLRQKRDGRAHLLGVGGEEDAPPRAKLQHAMDDEKHLEAENLVHREKRPNVPVFLLLLRHVDHRRQDVLVRRNELALNRLRDKHLPFNLGVWQVCHGAVWRGGRADRLAAGLEHVVEKLRPRRVLGLGPVAVGIVVELVLDRSEDDRAQRRAASKAVLLEQRHELHEHVRRRFRRHKDAGAVVFVALEELLLVEHRSNSGKDSASRIRIDVHARDKHDAMSHVQTGAWPHLCRKGNARRVELVEAKET